MPNRSIDADVLATSFAFLSSSVISDFEVVQKVKLTIEHASFDKGTS
jgi:hypothetical protein